MTDASPAKRLEDAGHCATPHPLEIIEEEHALQLELCDLLESIADDLPAKFEAAFAVIAISILKGSVKSHTKFEEDALFPLLRERLSPNDAVVQALACLSQEHERDEDIADELVEALKDALQSRAPRNPETLGYILRGYFESQRRHIAWEDSVVLPAARKALTVEDLARLQEWIMMSDHPRCISIPLLKLRARRSSSSICEKCPSSLRQEK
ncbi:hemerythrin domain-containing protein [Hyphomicrobium sp.]|uniref:hemerythrin domain-containing protein n=1 Tax=Hyphomicrobium sp. TaxID=82 RepID=UPI000FBBB70A|nr:hemerythrin domain-containing protein [Hyphomicrobium sp.]RUP09169.1 MAG: hemerythrin domain-containing protein [Hyphomicrobium sp.]